MRKYLIPLTALLLLQTSAVSASDFYEKSKEEIFINNLEKNNEIKEDSEFLESNNSESGVVFGVRGGPLTLKTEAISSTKISSVKIGEETVDVKVSISDKLIVSDLRGTGEGWHLTLSATPFTQKGDRGLGITDYSMPTGNFLIAGTPKVSAVSLSNKSDQPIVNFYGRSDLVSIDDGPVTVVSSYKNEGMGEWLIDFSETPFVLKVNNKSVRLVNDYKEPYTTTLTWSLVSGPGH